MAITKLHWLAVGEVTEAARMRIKNTGGFVRKEDAGPAEIYLVGIPCEILPDHHTDFRLHTWSRSEEAVIEIPSLSLKLSWSCHDGVPPNEASAAETVLDLWQA